MQSEQQIGILHEDALLDVNATSLFLGLNRYGFTFLPMERIHVQSKDVKTVISNIGGRWTAINILVFLLVEVCLTDRMMLRQV